MFLECCKHAEKTVSVSGLHRQPKIKNMYELLICVWPQARGPSHSYFVVFHCIDVTFLLDVLVSHTHSCWYCCCLTVTCIVPRTQAYNFTAVEYFRRVELCCGGVGGAGCRCSLEVLSFLFPPTVRRFARSRPIQEIIENVALPIVRLFHKVKG